MKKKSARNVTNFLLLRRNSSQNIFICVMTKKLQHVNNLATAMHSDSKM